LAASAKVDMVLRDDLKVLRPFLLKRDLFLIDLKTEIKEQINHPGRENNFVMIR
jgi:hypothetical protein